MTTKDLKICLKIRGCFEVLDEKTVAGFSFDTNVNTNLIKLLYLIEAMLIFMENYSEMCQKRNMNYKFNFRRVKDNKRSFGV